MPEHANLYNISPQRKNASGFTIFLPLFCSEPFRMAALPKVAAGGFSMDCPKDGKGNLSVAARRVTAANAPDLCGMRNTRPDHFPGAGDGEFSAPFGKTGVT